LSKYIPPSNIIPELYLEFARRLQPDDCIITFNYDVLLERSLDAVGKPYRLFPYRYKSFGRNTDFIDSSKEEIIILKMHGSIDWFDKSEYLELEQSFKEQGATILPTHPVFNTAFDWGISKVLDGPRRSNDPLLNMYRIAKIEDLYKKGILFMATPWILSPSTNKIIYARPLEEFWNGIGRSGGDRFGMAIIGYSLPEHDNYARQAIYSLTRNYQRLNWGIDYFGFRKTPLVLVDYKTSDKDINNFKNNYRFIDFEKSTLHINGFDHEAIEKIFA
jgi:hypothetical protein